MKEMKQSAIKAVRALWKTIPMILGTVLLVSLISVLIPKSFYISVFSKNLIFDSFVGALVGSVSAGTPITSYIISGELLNQGISLLAVTAFLVAWVTVGVVQLPAEAAFLGKRFAVIRNITAFVFAIIVASSARITLRFIFAWHDLNPALRTTAGAPDASLLIAVPVIKISAPNLVAILAATAASP